MREASPNLPLFCLPDPARLPYPGTAITVDPATSSDDFDAGSRF
jgi:hypothetical protein